MNANSLVILCIVLPFIVLQDQTLACAHTQLLTSLGIDTSTSMQGPSSISVRTGSSCVDPIVIEPQPNSLESILKDHAAKFVDESSEYLLTVDRITTEKLWMSVVTFYKVQKVCPNKLHKGLVILRGVKDWVHMKTAKSDAGFQLVV